MWAKGDSESFVINLLWLEQGKMDQQRILNAYFCNGTLT